MPVGRPWDGDRDELRRRFESGESDAEMAAAMGRTPGAIRDARKAAGLLRAEPRAKGKQPPVKWNAGVDDDVLAVHVHVGRTTAEIAKAMGRTVSQVQRARRRLDCPASAEWPAAELKELARLAAEGQSAQQIAQVMDKTEKAVTRAKERHGIRSQGQ